MWKLIEYYGRVQSTRGALGNLPGWARLVLFIFALPGIIGLLLSALALCVSLAALFLLTVPVYRLLTAVTGGRAQVQEVSSSSAEFVPATGEAPDFVEPEPVEAHDAERPSDRGFSVPTVVVESSPAVETPSRPRRQIDVRIVE